MKSIIRTLVFAVCIAAGLRAGAQTRDYDVFIPITKYIAQGNTDALSAWFSDNLDVSVLTKGGNSSKKQAVQLVNSFFSSHTPRSFSITHTAGRANMKYALGNLSAGGESYIVTIFMSCKNDSYRIQQFKIERVQ